MNTPGTTVLSAEINFDPALLSGSPADTLRIPESATDAERLDSQLAGKLVTLLGRLEVSCESLRRVAAPGNYLPAVQLASALVNELLAFDAPFGGLTCTRDAVRFVAATNVLLRDLNRHSYFGLKRVSLSRSEADQCAWLLSDLPKVLRAYFRQLVDSFHLPAEYDSWSIITAEFLASTTDLLRAIDRNI